MTHSLNGGERYQATQDQSEGYRCLRFSFAEDLPFQATRVFLALLLVKADREGEDYGAFVAMKVRPDIKELFVDDDDAELVSATLDEIESFARQPRSWERTKLLKNFDQLSNIMQTSGGPVDIGDLTAEEWIEAEYRLMLPPKPKLRLAAAARSSST